jgi:myo-inositol-1(or 4)-monophosphatase
MKSAYTEFGIELAKKAGATIVDNFQLSMEKKWKADNTPLTITDTAINSFVIDEVKKNYPTHSVLAEEGDFLLENSEYTWVCDPLDGTIPFSHGIPTSVFSLALTHNGEPIVGIIYDPFMDRLYSAEKGKGAFLNNTQMHVSQNSNMEQAVFGIPFWNGAPYDLVPFITTLQNTNAQIINLLSIAYMGSLVAAGELCGTVFPGSKPHDTAALKIIIEEAGGRITNLFGQQQRYDSPIQGHLISNGIFHDQLLEMLGTINPPSHQPS